MWLLSEGIAMRTGVLPKFGARCNASEEYFSKLSTFYFATKITKPVSRLLFQSVVEFGFLLNKYQFHL